MMTTKLKPGVSTHPLPHAARQPRFFYFGAVGSLLGLIALGLAWELALAPLRPGGSWMVLKVLPLLFPLRGVLKRDVYTMQWASMLILLYFTEGIVRATSDSSFLSSRLGWVEVALSVIFFFCTILYLRPYKKAAKEVAKQAIKKASQ
ncbi:DUF2069 domain-containing protein [Collimonas sp. OK412]|jgi:uncharacterized membrane protein|uniref:DUF2069 domain-containing protein n=1 Tax=Collimonas sp. (strain OK412) TaxID=1801619 RepID=UPI0008F346A4|nr:DUF2069 domain-containing protein [Collimonas sp. OK412]SFB81104.1 Uncharacterized membrane protein [Collimonas sp. OK412]